MQRRRAIPPPRIERKPPARRLLPVEAPRIQEEGRGGEAPEAPGPLQRRRQQDTEPDARPGQSGSRIADIPILRTGQDEQRKDRPAGEGPRFEPAPPSGARPPAPDERQGGPRERPVVARSDLSGESREIPQGRLESGPRAVRPGRGAHAGAAGEAEDPAPVEDIPGGRKRPAEGPDEEPVPSRPPPTIKQERRRQDVERERDLVEQAQPQQQPKRPAAPAGQEEVHERHRQGGQRAFDVVDPAQSVQEGHEVHAPDGAGPGEAGMKAAADPVGEDARQQHAGQVDEKRLDHPLAEQGVERKGQEGDERGLDPEGVAVGLQEVQRPLQDEDVPEPETGVEVPGIVPGRRRRRRGGLPVPPCRRTIANTG